MVLLLDNQPTTLSTSSLIHTGVFFLLYHSWRHLDLPWKTITPIVTKSHTTLLLREHQWRPQILKQILPWSYQVDPASVLVGFVAKLNWPYSFSHSGDSEHREHDWLWHYTATITTEIQLVLYLHTHSNLNSKSIFLSINKLACQKTNKKKQQFNAQIKWQ